MKHILLTGAGFTRNWGGWLAKELEGDLLGRVKGNERLRMRLQNAANFETALEELETESRRGDRTALTQRAELQRAIAEAFQAMNVALAKRRTLEFSSERVMSVAAFLAKFDSIFTLNQDLLLELLYDPQIEAPQRWSGCHWPGIVGGRSRAQNLLDRVSLKRRVSGTMQEQPKIQPIYKLHGSVDWQDESGELFVVGGGKETYIRSKPLLAGYFDRFRAQLAEHECRVMIIGYGFADEHVNRLLVESSAANTSLAIFHVHPEGRDAVHRGARERVAIYSPPALAALRCVGESRRSLSTTFDRDMLEHDKLNRFFG